MNRILLAALLAAFKAAGLVGGYLKRVALLSLLGLFAWLSISISHRNWYNFPTAYMIGEGIDQYAGALLAAVVIAKLVPAPESAF